MREEFSLADDLDCCPTLSEAGEGADGVKVRVVPDDLCRRIAQALRVQALQG